MEMNTSDRRLGAYANPLSKLDPHWRGALQTPAVSGLIALLLVQVVTALVLAGQGLHQVTPDEPLLGLSAQQVDGIEIVSTDDSLRLERSPDGWVLPELGGFPADTGKVDQLLTSLSDMPRSLPVASSAESRRRLKVADDDALIRVKLLGEGGTLAELLTGDSPGFRRLYGRLAGEDEVYDLPLASFEIASDSDDWVRRDRLRLDAEAIAQIDAGGWTLTRTAEGSWQLDGDERGLDQAEVEALVRRIANLSYQGVAVAPAETADSGEATLRLEIELDSGERAQRVVTRDGETGYLLQAGADPYLFRLSEYDLDGIVDADLDALRVKDEPEPTEAEAAADTAIEAPNADAEATDELQAAEVKGTEADQGPEPEPEQEQEPAADPATQPKAAQAPSPYSPHPPQPSPPEPTQADPARAEPEPQAHTDELAGEAGEQPASESAESSDTQPLPAEAAPTEAAPDGSKDEKAKTPSDTQAGSEAANAPAASAVGQSSGNAAARWPYQGYAPPQRPPWPPQNVPPRNPPAGGWR